MFEVTVDRSTYTTEIFHHILHYAWVHRDESVTCFKLYDDKRNVLNEDAYIARYETHIKIYTKGDYRTIPCSNQPDCYTYIVLRSDVIDNINKFIRDAEEYWVKSKFIDDSGTINIIKFNGCSWNAEYASKKRKSSSLYFSDDLYEKTKGGIQKFMDPIVKERYNSLGIPYSQTYLFYGVPGTGKTSLTFTLASELSMNMATINFTDQDMDDDELQKAIYRLPSNTILLLEDVDALFDHRDHKENGVRITFSGFLNALDGVVKADGLIVIMTTNFLKDINDLALRRRVDHYMEFKHMDKKQIQKMFQSFFPNREVPNEILKMKKLTPCILQKFLVRHLFDDDLPLDELTDLIEIIQTDETLKENMYT